MLIQLLSMWCNDIGRLYEYHMTLDWKALDSLQKIWENCNCLIHDLMISSKNTLWMRPLNNFFIIWEFLFLGGGALQAVFLKCFSEIFFPDWVKSMWCIYSKHPSFQGGCFEYTHHILLTRSGKNASKKNGLQSPPPKKKKFPLKKYWGWKVWNLSFQILCRTHFS